MSINGINQNLSAQPLSRTTQAQPVNTAQPAPNALTIARTPGNDGAIAPANPMEAIAQLFSMLASLIGQILGMVQPQPATQSGGNASSAAGQGDSAQKSATQSAGQAGQSAATAQNAAGDDGSAEMMALLQDILGQIGNSLGEPEAPQASAAQDDGNQQAYAPQPAPAPSAAPSASRPAGRPGRRQGSAAAQDGNRPAVASRRNSAGKVGNGNMNAADRNSSATTNNNVAGQDITNVVNNYHINLGKGRNRAEAIADCAPMYTPAPTPAPAVEYSPAPTPAPAVEYPPAPTPAPAVEYPPAPTPAPAVEYPPAPTPAPAVQYPPAPTPAPAVEYPPAPTPAPAVEYPPAPAPTPPAPPPAYNDGNGGSYWGDPHFVGFGGEKYDVMGEAGKTYNILSDKGVQYNADFIAWGKPGKDGVQATVIGKAGLQVGKSQVAIDRSGKAPTVDGKAMEKDKDYALDNDGSANWNGKKLSVKTQEYTTTLEVKENKSGDYLDSDVKINEGVNPLADGVAAHGILGQTADGVTGERKGADNTNVEKQGGTVIDGIVADYEVQDIHDIDFLKNNRSQVA